MLDWSDNTKRKAFRLALQEAYPESSALEIFVDEELNENLETVAGGANLQVTSHGLIKWARAKGKLDEVYAAFKQENPSHSVIDKLERQDFFAPAFNLSQRDWDALAEHLVHDDFPDLWRAFNKGFQAALRLKFNEANPQHPPLTGVQDIREQLEIYDATPKGPVLAVRFVEYAIAELRRSDETRDLSALEAWGNQMSERFKVPPPEPSALSPEQPTLCHAYLLIALEELGADVNVYPELRITGSEKPTAFRATPTTCPIGQVAEHISGWIRQAEASLEAETCDDQEVTLEVFLPRQYLDTDIATTWLVIDEDGDEVPLGTHRRFLVRSADRIRKNKDTIYSNDKNIVYKRNTLQGRWKKFEACVQDQTICDRFHVQPTCPQGKGQLLALLKDGDALGLKFVAQLPTDLGKRSDVFKDMINAPIPIAMWSSAAEVANVEAEFDALLGAAHLTNFADLARQWRKRRLDEATAEAAKPIRLLCDRPDRWPHLPDPSREEDLLVAS
ncbi:MAG: effector-associated domain EAD1-containing protein [Cyanobacteria bacterium J06559_3]